MFKIQQVTNDTFQKQVLILGDGTQLTMFIYFRPQQFGWFISELSYQGFILQGLRITNSPNFLHQFRNKIPFGMACFSTSNREPTQQDDFSSGQSILYILSAAEVAEYTRYLSGQV